MSRVSYVPYSQDFADVFAFCGIELPTSEYGPNTGWDAAAFSTARGQAKDYLDSLYDNDDPDDDVQADYYYDMLENGDYTVFYWSTESPIYG